jgi:hypothetical protein
MNSARFLYSIRLPLPAEPLSPDWLGPKFIATIDALTRIDPAIFADWEVLDLWKGLDLEQAETIPLAMARLRGARIMVAHLNDAGQPDPDHGYAAVAMTTAGADSRHMGLSVATYGGALEGAVELKAGDVVVPADMAIVTYPIFRLALLAINEIWLPPWSLARVMRLGTIHVPTGDGGSRVESVAQVPSDPTFPDSFLIPWMVYLSAEFASGLELPPGILTERMSDGGVLMTATKERLDPDNPEHVRSARILAEILIKQTECSAK